MYKKPESEWTTFEKVLKFIGDNLFTALFIYGLIDNVYKYTTGQRGVIFSAVVGFICLYIICDFYDMDAQKYGWGRYKNKKKS